MRHSAKVLPGLRKSHREGGEVLVSGGASRGYGENLGLRGGRGGKGESGKEKASCLSSDGKEH